MVQQEACFKQSISLLRSHDRLSRIEWARTSLKFLRAGVRTIRESRKRYGSVQF